MSLNKKQVIFTRTVGVWLGKVDKKGIEVILAEVYRPPAMAKIYAEQGKGIVNSVHTKKLAFDAFIYLNGTVTWNAEDYREIGELWKSLHPLARWGGDFKGRDAVHFSFEHNGVK